MAAKKHVKKLYSKPGVTSRGQLPLLPQPQPLEDSKDSMREVLKGAFSLLDSRVVSFQLDAAEVMRSVRCSDGARRWVHGWALQVSGNVVALVHPEGFVEGDDNKYESAELVLATSFTRRVE